MKICLNSQDLTRKKGMTWGRERIRSSYTGLPAGFVGTVYAIWDVMDDVPTSIKTNIMSKDQCMYDILGRRVDNTYKGIVIIDGKKYLLK